ncbi:HNH endonuclease signature motif containing protein [Streptomyces lavendulae]|uniref:HNH endonuclease signature motif containing protein n=1 Tax=Streptomyces lavendulae TaxID=1914 RepID=UPI00367BD76F
MDERSLKRFMRKVKAQPNGCWYIDGRVRRDGYSDFTLLGKHQLGHRVAYEHFIGSVPEGLQVDHLCHTGDLDCPGGFTCAHRRCVNPDHLEAVTHRENSLRGRSPAALNAVKTECAAGHLFTEETTYLDPKGRRECRTCRARLGRQWVKDHHPGVRHGTETHCPQGHPYSGENLVITSNGGRACRTCRRDSNREYMRAKRARAKAMKNE